MPRLHEILLQMLLIVIYSESKKINLYDSFYDGVIDCEV